MPRANRYLTAGCCYHLTHRCHNQKFLLKFARDRDLYRSMLRDLAISHSVLILGYTLTSNHVHLLVKVATRDSLSHMMHDLAGEFSRVYNRRKARKDAFWAGRYHASLIDGCAYLWRCMRYIDLNMVRAGVVAHPREWAWCGYQELSGLRQRYRLIDQAALLTAFDLGSDFDAFFRAYDQDLTLRIRQRELEREAHWTESLAIGSKAFVESCEPTIKNRCRLESRELHPGAGDWVLRESRAEYA